MQIRIKNDLQTTAFNFVENWFYNHELATNKDKKRRIKKLL